MPVSLYGQPSDMDEINALAVKHGIPVIEDAAQSFGSTYKGKKSCNLSTIGCTSFFPSKPLGCYGDGGAIFTSNDNIAEKCMQIRSHGQSERYLHIRVGVGGRMDTLQCAIVLAKFDRFEWEIQQRQKIGKIYNEFMDEIDIRRIFQKEDRTSVYAQYTIRINNRERIMLELEKKGIPTSIHYPKPLNKQPAYAHLCCNECTPIANKLASEVLSLPMSPDLSFIDQSRIIEALKNLKEKS